MPDEEKKFAIGSTDTVFAAGVVAPAPMERPKEESLEGFIEFMRAKKDIPRTKEEIIAEARREKIEERVIQAFAEIPREEFIHPRLREFSYFDFPIPVVYDSFDGLSSIPRSVPKPSYIMRLLTHLDTRPSHSILQLPTSSGYVAALLSRLTHRVDHHDWSPINEKVSENFKRLGLNNIHWCPGSPLIVKKFPNRYDRILVTATAPELPKELLDLLVEDGKMIIPIVDDQRVKAEDFRKEPPPLQKLYRSERRGGTLVFLGYCRFTPLEYGRFNEHK